MAIVFDCVCGTEIEALDGQAGRKVMCPSCRSDLTVPPRSTASKPEPVPDLGIVVGAPTRLYRPKRSKAGLVASGVAGVAENVARMILIIPLAVVLLALILALIGVLQRLSRG